jgi:cytolysin (calcineurin-like family phosphatase)
MRRIAFGVAATLVAALWPLVLGAGGVPRDVTFILTSDCHYDAFENEDRNARNRETVLHMNEIITVQWPAPLGGGAIGRPRGVLVLGDVIDDGDRVLEGKPQTEPQWRSFVADFGLLGGDALLAYPVFEGWGNHDGPPIGAERHGFSFQARLRERNLLRKDKELIAALSERGLHYSWDWDDVHFVQVNIYPADRQHPAIKYNPTWHDPQGALRFLREDLAARVGTSGRPVVVLSHCGFDADWWHAEDKQAVYETLRPYRVLLYCFGHSGTGIWPWAPPGAAPPLDCINTGQTENGFFVVQVTATAVRAAYRTKAWLPAPAGGKPDARVWGGAWEWRHTFKKDL